MIIFWLTNKKHSLVSFGTQKGLHLVCISWKSSQNHLFKPISKKFTWAWLPELEFILYPVPVRQEPEFHKLNSGWNRNSSVIFFPLLNISEHVFGKKECPFYFSAWAKLNTKIVLQTTPYHHHTNRNILTSSKNRRTLKLGVQP